MEIIAGPFAIVAVVLAVGGLAKLAKPEPSGATLRSLGIPASAVLVRVLALCEIAIAIAALAFGGTLGALAVSAAFGAFTLMMYLLVRRGSTASCGCFGQAEAPPGPLHVGLNAICASVAAAAAALDVIDMKTLLGDQPANGVPMVLLVGTGSAATIAMFTVFGRLSAPIDTGTVRTFSINT
ncbi:MAG: hypothetical protein IH940_11595 [Acidobacteria bacterium]|nr:hypothetical protein [Acidobacteriota bacterium]